MSLQFYTVVISGHIRGRSRAIPGNVFMHNSNKTFIPQMTSWSYVWHSCPGDCAQLFQSSWSTACWVRRFQNPRSWWKLLTNSQLKLTMLRKECPGAALSVLLLMCWHRFPKPSVPGSTWNWTFQLGGVEIPGMGWYGVTWRISIYYTVPNSHFYIPSCQHCRWCR